MESDCPIRVSNYKPSPGFPTNLSYWKNIPMSWFSVKTTLLSSRLTTHRGLLHTTIELILKRINKDSIIWLWLLDVVDAAGWADHWHLSRGACPGSRYWPSSVQIYFEASAMARAADARQQQVTWGTKWGSQDASQHPEPAASGLCRRVPSPSEWYPAVRHGESIGHYFEGGFCLKGGERKGIGKGPGVLCWWQSPRQSKNAKKMRKMEGVSGRSQYTHWRL